MLNGSRARRSIAIARIRFVEGSQHPIPTIGGMCDSQACRVTKLSMAGGTLKECKVVARGVRPPAIAVLPSALVLKSRGSETLAATVGQPSLGRSGRRLRASYCTLQRGQACSVDIRTAILSFWDLRELGMRNLRTEAIVPAEAHDHRPPEIRIDSVLVMWRQERRYNVHTLDPPDM